MQYPPEIVTFKNSRSRALKGCQKPPRYKPILKAILLSIALNASAANVQVFFQFGCAACIEAHQVLQDRHDLQYRFVTTQDSNSQQAAKFMYCLRQKSEEIFSLAFDELIDKSDDELSPSRITELVAPMGIDYHQFESCVSSRLANQMWDADQKAFNQSNFVGTPAYIFYDAKGKQVLYQGSIKSN